ncbi:Gfo/Idh/MocA family protein [Naasia sp. SYSU D00948]|uniref:Gfo/Idh/MocA family protein n=1 Tax=Naasia sp. SYSU D00948 TaxID=2817379 RepID=UPI001B3009C9|nr:Gfo/Idh/MocA family oxidoreductase [Naasia sp. SYSU D00948]
MRERDSVRWGIVGTGGIARRVTPDFELAGNAARFAVASRAHSAAEAFAEEFGVERAYGDYMSLLLDPDVDAVYLATPSATHARMAMQALAAGKHILVEKPLGLDVREVEKISDAARRSGLFAMEAMWTKFSPLFPRLMEALTGGEIGEVRSVRASFGFPPSSARGPEPFSAVLDRGVYPLTLAQKVFGEPQEVVARGVVGTDGLDSAVHVLLDYGGGRTAYVAASRTEYIDPSASVSGTGGWVQIPAPFWAASSSTVRSGSVWQALSWPRTLEVAVEGNGYAPMLRAAGEAILNGAGEHPTHPLADTMSVTAVMDEIRAQVARL